jgi:glutamate:GABA antiporter
MEKKVTKHHKTLSVFTLAMINVAAIGSVKNWPFTAEYGFSSLFYFILAALLFFFPISMVSAELATGWPHHGGVYLWVKEAFGKRWGFLAVWLQWIENVVWYPTVLSFTASTIAYIFAPELASNSTYTLIMVLVLYWGATIANFFGMKTSGHISNLGAICGTFIPGIFIIVLGCFWVFEGNPLQIAFSWQTLIPDFSFNNMVLFTGVMLAFAGMEMSSVHALDVKNPQRDYPKAIFLSGFLILGLSILGVLAIAIVVPHEEISFTAGTMQAFTYFLNRYHLDRLIPVIAALMAVGLFGSVSTWIIGPSKGLLAAGWEGNLPPLFHKTNKKHAPVSLMIGQGVIATILSLMFLLMPNVSSGFWILTVLVAQLYLLMYILVFAAGIKLRYSHPHVDRPYRVKGGLVGMWTMGIIGILGSSFALIIGYLPPSQIEVGSATFYTSFLLIGSIVCCLAPFAILFFKKESWNHSSHQVESPK